MLEVFAAGEAGIEEVGIFLKVCWCTRIEWMGKKRKYEGIHAEFVSWFTCKYVAQLCVPKWLHLAIVQLIFF